MKEIILQVVFNFGGVAYVTVKKQDGETLEKALKRRSDDIEGYILNGVYITL